MRLDVVGHGRALINSAHLDPARLAQKDEPHGRIGAAVQERVGDEVRHDLADAVGVERQLHARVGRVEDDVAAGERVAELVDNLQAHAHEVIAFGLDVKAATEPGARHVEQRPRIISLMRRALTLIFSASNRFCSSVPRLASDVAIMLIALSGLRRSWPMIPR